MWATGCPVLVRLRLASTQGQALQQRRPAPQRSSGPTLAIVPAVQTCAHLRLPGRIKGSAHCTLAGFSAVRWACTQRACLQAAWSRSTAWTRSTLSGTSSCASSSRRTSSHAAWTWVSPPAFGARADWASDGCVPQRCVRHTARGLPTCSARQLRRHAGHRQPTACAAMQTSILCCPSCQPSCAGPAAAAALTCTPTWVTAVHHKSALPAD